MHLWIKKSFEQVSRVSGGGGGCDGGEADGGHGGGGGYGDVVGEDCGVS